MSVSRRKFAQWTGAVAALPLLSRRASAEAWPEGVQSSDLIYLTPLKSDGGESSCQGEGWFQAHEDALYVVTAAGAWRAEAVRKGLARTRVWVGDVGTWSDSDGAYRSLPQLELTGSLVVEPGLQSAVLEKMGEKYSMSWLVWGPRFRDGLADGSRVMLRYA